MDEAKEYSEGIKTYTITAEEAQKKYGKTISYDRHKFFCKYCGEYVTFVRENKKKPYFRHRDENEDTRACNLRAEKNENVSLYEKLGPSLYLEEFKNDFFKLKVGFSGIREEFNEILEKYDPEIIIEKGNNEVKYSLKNFNKNEINFKNLEPKSKYSISYEAKEGLPNIIKKKFFNKWGAKIEGIIAEGSLFNKKGKYHRKIRANDEVSLFTDYYLVSKYPYELQQMDGIFLKKIGQLSIEERAVTPYIVYDIRFDKIKESDVRKIREILKVILVEKLEEISLVWPPAIENDNIISTIEDKRNLFIIKNKEERTKVFKHEGISAVSVPIEYFKNCFLFQIRAREKENQITINDEYGSIYLILNKYLKEINGYENYLECFDEKNNFLENGDYTKLPFNKKIRVKSASKTTIIQLKKNNEIISYKIDREDGVTVNDIEFGDKIYQIDGIEKKLLLSFIKNNLKDKEKYDYDLIYRKIHKENGEKVEVPIWIRNILYFIPCNTKLYNLIKKYTYSNRIPFKVILILKIFFNGDIKKLKEINYGK